MFKRVLPIFLLFSVVVNVFALNVSALQNVDDYVSKSGKFDNTYINYISNNKSKENENGEIICDFSSARLSNGGKIDNYSGKENVVALNEPGASLCLDIVSSSNGFYNIFVNYCGIIDSDKSIKLNVLIDGENPFFEASSVELSRCYQNITNEFEKDSLGNELRPAQKQMIFWLV